MSPDMVSEPETPLSEDEHLLFDAVVSLFRGAWDDMQPALYRAQLDGHNVAVICAMLPTDEGNGNGEAHWLKPLAILIDDTLGERLNPGDEVTKVRTQ